jgi:hypothetical protein
MSLAFMGFTGLTGVVSAVFIAKRLNKAGKAWEEDIDSTWQLRISHNSLLA